MKRFDLLKVDDPEAGHVDLELYFFTEVLKLESLHYGYWSKDQERVLANLGVAQAAYTQSLIGLIPEGVSRVLDVGCGAGDNSRAMAGKGLDVTAISPDAEHGKFVQDTPGVDFVRTKIEQFETDKTFELILMSECQNYFDRDLALAKCIEVLEPGGHLLISGMFRRSPTDDFDDMYIGDEYIAAAEGVGLELVTQIDITAETVPTLEMARNAYRNHLVPAGKLAVHYINNTARWKMALIRTFFAKQWRSLTGIGEFVERRVDVERFEKFVVYQRLLFRKKVVS